MPSDSTRDSPLEDFGFEAAEEPVFHPPAIRGRGAAENPANRFESKHFEPDPEWFDEEAPAPETQFYLDASRSILATNNSPDIPFEYSINPYRGCEHGCVYCYARPTHEYLGFSAGLDFETRIMIKQEAATLLRKELMRPAWKGDWIAISGVTDAYQPIERGLRLTRACLEVLVEFRNPLGIVTKNALVARDIDLLGELAPLDAVQVLISVTTLDPELARTLEPRASSPTRRLEAIESLSSAGIPTGVLIAPLIPGLNDHEVPALLKACADAGARFAGYVLLRLPLTVAPLFEAWLERHRPASKSRVLRRLTELRAGRLNTSAFHERQRGRGPLADRIAHVFAIGRQQAGLDSQPPKLSNAHFRRPGQAHQGGLFD